MGSSPTLHVVVSDINETVERRKRRYNHGKADVDGVPDIYVVVLPGNIVAVSEDPEVPQYGSDRRHASESKDEYQARLSLD